MLPESNIMYIECPTSIILNATYITPTRTCTYTGCNARRNKKYPRFFNNKN